MSYIYTDPSGTSATVTDDGRLIVSDTQYNQLVIGLTSVGAQGIVAALTDQFPEVPGLPDDAEVPPEAQSEPGA